MAASTARDDFAIFGGLADRLGVGAAFANERNEEGWLRHLYVLAWQSAAAEGHALPDFDAFWRDGLVLLPKPETQEPLLADFRTDSEAAGLKTPSDRIEIHSETIAGFGYADCPGYPTWLESDEWLGAGLAARYTSNRSTPRRPAPCSRRAFSWWRRSPRRRIRCALF